MAERLIVHRDASFHGYEPARYSYLIVLSMLEDGALTWQDQYKMAEERRLALIALSAFSHDVGSREALRDGSGGSGWALGNCRNGHSQPCNYFNNRTCFHKVDNITNVVL
jgi:hypothetical protein